jgi:GDP-4-dehydro-6-deoxy-D-mannose reductase
MALGRVLVTGASGFVGSHLVPRLAADGAQVYALGTEAAPALVAHLAGAFIADLRDEAAIRDAVAAARPDAIVHLAALSSAGKSFADPALTHEVNAKGTGNLLAAARDAAPAARILMVSTSEVYGPQPAGTRTREDAPFHPVSPYAESKVAAEQLAETAVRDGGLDVIRARAFSHTGPGQTPTFVVPGWADQIVRIERGELPPVLQVGNLEVTRDLSDVSDVVDAYRALLAHGVRGEAYNVCRGEGVRLADVAARMAAMASVPVRIEVDPGRLRPADVPWLVGDPAKIEAATGWRASTPLDKTLSAVLDHRRRSAA